MMGEAKPKEGGVAAFFDLDGTLVPGPSLEWRFFRELRKNHRIPFINYLRWTSESFAVAAKTEFWRCNMTTNITWLACAAT